MNLHIIILHESTYMFFTCFISAYMFYMFLHNFLQDSISQSDNLLYFSVRSHGAS